MKLVPLADRVIVKMVEVEETTASGIILASSAKREFKKNSKILDDATYTVESTTTASGTSADSAEGGSDSDNIKY